MIKKISDYIVICTLFMIFFDVTFANERNTPPAYTKNHMTAQKKSRNIQEVKELRSYRGIRFIYAQDTNSQLVHIKIAFNNSGAAYQELSKAGVPYLYSSTVFKGCGKYSSAQFERETSTEMINIFCAAGIDRVRFHLTAPLLTIDKGVSLLNAAICDPKFEKEKVKISQESVIAILQDYSINRNLVAIYTIIPSLLFKSHSYASGLFGSAENFIKLNVDDLQQYRKNFIIANNAEGCIFGNISEEKAKSLIDKIFENVNDGKISENSVEDIQPAITKFQKKYFVKGSGSSIIFALKGVKIKSKDRFAARIFTTIFGEGSVFKGRLLGILRGKGYIYSGSISTINYDHSDYIIGILQTDNKKVDQAISALKDIIRDFREKGITETELQFAKKLLKGSTVIGLRNSDNLSGFCFSAMLKGLGLNALSDFLNGIDNVTLSEVNMFCKNNLNENEIPFIIMGGNANE
ncbi:MAG: insulinase family protein [Alphaproteobacteria bacterium]|nr:insulinase family protein [Alphaproteobacteria bacterium]